MKFFHLPTLSFSVTEEYRRSLAGVLKRLLSFLFIELLHTVKSASSCEFILRAVKPPLKRGKVFLCERNKSLQSVVN